MPELRCSAAASVTGKMGSRAVTPRNITEQVKRLQQSLVPSFFWQALPCSAGFPVCPAISRSRLKRCPGRRVSAGSLGIQKPATEFTAKILAHKLEVVLGKSSTQISLNYHLLMCDMVQKRSWEMNFLFGSPLLHQPIEDLISIPSNSSALTPTPQVKKRILSALPALGGRCSWNCPAPAPLGCSQTCPCLGAQGFSDGTYGVKPDTGKHRTGTMSPTLPMKNEKISLCSFRLHCGAAPENLISV